MNVGRRTLGRRRGAALLIALLTASGAASADAPTAPKAAPPAEVATAVVAAWKAGDADAVHGLAATKTSDPWLVAEELVARGEHEAATSFAQADPRPDTERLPSWVEARRGQPTDTAAREAIAKAEVALAAKDAAGALATVDASPVPPDLVLRLRRDLVRVEALRVAKRLAEVLAVAVPAAAEAERLGWLRMASDLLRAGAFASEHAASIELLTRRLAIDERRGDGWRVAHSLMLRGYDYIALDRDEDVIADLGRAVPLLAEGWDATTRANTLRRLGVAHENLRRLPQAKAWYERAIAEQAGLGASAPYARTLRDLADVEEKSNDLAAARRRRVEALAMSERVRDAEGVAAAHRALASMDADAGRFADARVHLEAAVPAAREAKDDEELADVLDDLGILLVQMKQAAAARPILEESIAIAERLDERRTLEYATEHLGLALQDLQDYAGAVRSLERALALSEKGDDVEHLENVRLNLASTIILLGETVRGAELLGQVRQRMRASGAPLRKVGEALLNEGQALWVTGDYAAALDRLEEARSIFEPLGEARALAVAHLGLGNVRMFLGDAERAREHFAKSSEWAEKDHDVRAVALALFSRGTVALQEGDAEAALPDLESARASFEAIGDDRSRAMALANIGLSQELLGANDAAIAALDASRAITHVLGDRIGEVRARVSAANVRRKRGELDFALEEGTEGVRIARDVGSVDTVVRALGLVAQVRLARGDAPGAIAACREAVSALPRLVAGQGDVAAARARRGFADLFDLGLEASLAAKDVDAAWFFLESGRAGALLESLGGRPAVRTAALPADLRRREAEALAAETAARSAREKALRAGDRAEAAARTAALEAASRGVADVIDEIQRKEKRTADLAYPTAAPLARVTALLRPDEALVLYALREDASTALVVTRDGARSVALAPAAAIREACERALPPDGADVVPAALPRLAELLVAPLGLGPEVRRVLLSPDGVLTWVPFSAVVGDRDVAFVPSGTTYALLRAESATAGEGTLALGDPAYATEPRPPPVLAEVTRSGARLTRLPATADEARAVGTTVLLGAEATESGLRKALASRERWRSVHLACHALVDPARPLSSCLALTPDGTDDGFLTAMEILRWKVPADLVVLSACESGRGAAERGEGLVGLVRAFMLAGAPRVLCSLWKVDDDATKALMTKLYERWKAGSPLSRALAEAQAFVRSQERWSHPKYWAAWMLWGPPD